jgi:hypothetical protein
MLQATATPVTYRKTKTGEWVVFGPADRVTTGRQVNVRKKDGSIKLETVVSVGKPFQVDGQQMVYGYLDRGRPQSGSYSTPRQGHRQRRACITAGNCSSFGDGRDCGGYDCDGY